MDLDALFILLQPWLRPFLAFVFFTFLRIFTEPYYCVYCIVLTAKHPLNTEKTC